MTKICCKNRMKWIFGIVLQWLRFKHFQQNEMLDPSHASHEKKFVRLREGSLYNIPIDIKLFDLDFSQHPQC